MKINEIQYKTPYDLQLGGESANQVKKSLQDRGITQSMVYQRRDNPEEVFFVFWFNRAWEVHHLLNPENGDFISGTKERRMAGANARYFATIKNLYEDRLASGSAVRIVMKKPEEVLDTDPEEIKKEKARKNLTKTYVKVFGDISLDTDKYDITKIDNYIDFDGTVSDAIEIRPRGKFESLQKNRYALTPRRRRRVARL